MVLINALTFTQSQPDAKSQRLSHRKPRCRNPLETTTHQWLMTWQWSAHKPEWNDEREIRRWWRIQKNAGCYSGVVCVDWEG